MQLCRYYIHSIYIHFNVYPYCMFIQFYACLCMYIYASKCIYIYSLIMTSSTITSRRWESPSLYHSYLYLPYITGSGSVTSIYQSYYHLPLLPVYGVVPSTFQSYQYMGYPQYFLEFPEFTRALKECNSCLASRYYHYTLLLPLLPFTGN